MTEPQNQPEPYATPETRVVAMTLRRAGGSFRIISEGQEIYVQLGGHRRTRDLVRVAVPPDVRVERVVA
jgi:hypothetical protein